MGKYPTRFQLINGRIWLVMEQLVWGEFIELHREDVTDKVMPVVDDFLDESLGLKQEYAHNNGKLTHVEKNK